jgi:hypothetical protein
LKYCKKPVVIEAITFDEFVEYGRSNGANIVNNMPWSFKYNGHPVTHENDECYLIPTLEGTHNFTPKDMLITGVNGEIYPCKLDIFEKTYDVCDCEEAAEESYLEYEPKEDFGHSFKELFPTFIAGTPIKRKVWRGYWVYKYGKIEIHTKTGEVINFTDTTDILFTVSGILENDWEVATNENCDIPVK